MADRPSEGSDSDDCESSDDNFNGAAAALQRRIEHEVYPPDSSAPLQLPTKLLQRAQAAQVASPGGSSTSGETSGPSIGPVLNEKMIRIDSLYIISPEPLCSSDSSVTFKCTDRHSGRPFACKRIKKLPSNVATEWLRSEVSILHYLSGLPHIVKFERAYEDEDYVYLIMELCEGGDLFDMICDCGGLPEQQARRVFRQIIKAVHCCHLMGITHRDIKPENVVLVDRSWHPLVRLIDFGLSFFFVEGNKNTYRSGTIEYMAPEVLQRWSGKEADVWSAGVLLYHLLSGRLPFEAPTTSDEDEAALLLENAIQGGEFDIEEELWPSISESAKDLVRKMLNTDPESRIATSQILKHPWVEEEGVPLPRQLSLPPLFNFFSMLTRIRTMTLIRRLGLMTMAEQLPMESIRDYKQIFRSISTGDGGLISFEDFCNKLFLIGSRATEDELKNFTNQNTVVNGGNAHFMELVVAMVPSYLYEKDEFLLPVFGAFRKPGTWCIDKKGIELSFERYFGRQPSEELVNAALQEVGIDPNGEIDETQFFKIMKEPVEQKP